MYQKLSELYKGPDDIIYLFGFNRGAFTVRALAGLLYHCGLAGKDVGEDQKTFESCFSDAYGLYTHYAHGNEDPARITVFRKKYAARDCKIYFVGIWDTVNSYGGIWPKLLPYLRHNPIVGIVRHAVALNERRSWFNATTWGQLDSDKQGAKKRLKKEDLPAYKSRTSRGVVSRLSL